MSCTLGGKVFLSTNTPAHLCYGKLNFNTENLNKQIKSCTRFLFVCLFVFINTIRFFKCVCFVRSMPSGSSHYQAYPSHLQRTGVLSEAYPTAMDLNAPKEQSRDAGKNRGGLPKHFQDQHGPSSKSDPKLSSPSPGGLYPGSYTSASGRPQHLLPLQSDNPPGRGESGTPSREKTQNKQMSIQEQELRSLGKTTMTAANFINAIIMRQISCETGMPEMGSLVASSATNGKTLWIPGVPPHHPDPLPRQCVAYCTLWWLALSDQQNSFTFLFQCCSFFFFAFFPSFSLL